MPKKSLAPPPEITVTRKATTKEIYRHVRDGHLRKIAPKLYTPNFTDSPEIIVKRNIWEIVAGLYPKALICDRTAFEMQPAEDDSICIISGANGEQKLPGLIIRSRTGTGPQSDDLPFTHGLFLSSQARAYLENLRPSRSRGGRLRRTLESSDIEARLEKLLVRSGEAALNRLRDRVDELAPVLDLHDEAKRFSDMVGALLGTRAAALQTASGRARRDGEPYDPDRIKLFHTLHAALRDWPPQTHPVDHHSTEQRSIFAFYEAYFSNFIEGTEFAVDEARDIIFRGRIPANRPRDAHDIRGTFNLAMKTEPRLTEIVAFDSFVTMLRRSNAEIMAGRPEKNPGEFKSIVNRAGASLFVQPELVGGTLRQGLSILQTLEAPFQRAVFVMFLIAEIHPFDDGNGRTARILMNSELSAGGEKRIIIPTIYRGNYISALKALTHNGNPQPLIRALEFAWRWTASVDFSSFDAAHADLNASNAFEESDTTDNRLRMPS